jgi:hypothetical protein
VAKKGLIFFSLVALIASSAGADIGEIDIHSGPPAEPSSSHGDRSALWLKSGSRITLLVSDAQGHHTGVEPKGFKVVKGVPESSCDVDFIGNKYTGEEHAEADERITFDPAKKGVYTLLVHGLQSGPFQISISALARNGSSEPSKEVEGLISEGEDKVFKLTYDPAPNATLSVVDTSS